MMSLGTHTCPNCQHVSVMEVRPQHYYTCAACKQSFIEYNTTPEKPEIIIPKTETMSPVLMGSKGKMNGEQFTVSGCVTLFQERTTVNLYSVLWAHGLYGFIIECDGDYVLTSFVDETPEKSLKETKVGSNITIASFGKAYCYSVDKTKYISLKGEGWFPFERLSASLFCSYYSEKQKAAFGIFVKEKITLLTGKFYTFNELNLSPARSSHDWYK